MSFGDCRCGLGLNRVANSRFDQLGCSDLTTVSSLSCIDALFAGDDADPLVCDFQFRLSVTRTPATSLSSLTEEPPSPLPPTPG